MWISKKKHEAELRKVKNEALIESLTREGETEQWNDIQKLKKDVKKLKKWVKNGY